MVPQAGWGRGRRPGRTATGALDGPGSRAYPLAGATSRRTSVAGTHAVDLVEAKGLRLEVVGSCLATVGGSGAWVRADGRSGDTRDDHRQGPQAGRPIPDAEDRRALCRGS